MEVKVLWLDLPKGTGYQEVIVAGERRVGIVYKEICQPKEKVEIPKPEALVGGSVVYQNDDVPYWYCRIKNGRDTFMHVYMEDLTEDDLLYDSKTGKMRKFSTNREKRYKKNVLKALENKPEEGFRWIAVYEPSPEPNGSVQFVKGNFPLRGLSCIEWDKMLKEYAPENESAGMSKTTYFLLTLRWLKDGLATLEQVVNHSEELLGNYMDSQNSKRRLEKTGERRFGGLYGFVGNTNIILEDPKSESGYSHFGGYCYSSGNASPLSYVEPIPNPCIRYDFSIGWTELRK